MESTVTRQAHEALIEAARKLSPEERLNAFLAHCELMMELYQAGENERKLAPGTEST